MKKDVEQAVLEKVCLFFNEDDLRRKIKIGQQGSSHRKGQSVQLGQRHTCVAWAIGYLGASVKAADITVRRRKRWLSSTFPIPGFIYLFLAV